MAITKTYLVCPLNWGLGHASRLIPIINQLLNDKQNIILCGDGNALTFLCREFPELEFIRLKDLSIKFSPSQGVFNLIKIIPQLIYQVFYEHKAINRIIQKHQVEIIISDNRYGLWNKKVHSIFITHQLMVKLPKPFGPFENLVHKIIKRIIQNYNECWIPDYKDKNNNLSGDLSHKYLVNNNTKFIEPLSRFSLVGEKKTIIKNYDIVAVISGPEPSRSYFEEILYNTLYNSKYETLIIQGKPNKHECVVINNITKVSSLDSTEIKAHLLTTKLIITRSGYSSLMDLSSINKKALLIPTPGQTEQEYLAAYHAKSHYTCSQYKFDLNIINQIIPKA